MNRIFLALLALFAGLVAPVAPAHARLGGAGSAEIGAVESAGLIVRNCTAPAAAIDQPACRAERRDKAARVRTVRSRVFIPAVLLGPDRALE
ncbi:MAG: hypothetical protein JSR28_06815 [Proteobacteria bacterium]|nr:hypothetical protein [Pseudomonadota bacterium]MDE2412318.1 hypothetical protein [Sphingomonadales bacterium]